MSDQEDVESLSRRLAGIDFSAESRIRASLRAKLLRKQRSAAAAPRLAPASVAILSLVLTAAVLVLLFPLRARLHRSGEVRIAAQVRLPAAPPRTPPVESRCPKPAETVFPRGELDLPVLPGRLAGNAPSGEEPPISTRTIDRLIEIHRGRTVPLTDGSAVVWEIDGAAYGLETRKVSLNDIFETRSL